MENPATISMDSNMINNITNTNRQEELIYGLLEINIEAYNIGGTVEITIDLPSPAPERYTWYKYGYRYDKVNKQYDQDQTWYDYTDHVVFSTGRD